MALYERLTGRDATGVEPEPPNELDKIPVHGFSAIMREYGRGTVTKPQAQASIDSISGSPLNAGEITEADTLLDTITGNASQKLARALEIDDVLILAELDAAGYHLPSEIETKLGV